jgi:hypothetical protein
MTWDASDERVVGGKARRHGCSRCCLPHERESPVGAQDARCNTVYGTAAWSTQPCSRRGPSYLRGTRDEAHRPITITESVTSESRDRVMTDPRRCRMKPIGFLPSGTVNPPECSVARWALRTTCHGLLDARASVVVPGHSQLAVQVILLARSRGDDCITSERDDGGSHSVADAQYDIPRLRAGLSRDHRGDAG